MQRKSNPMLIGLIALIWFFIVVLGYFVTHKPFSAEAFLAFIRVIGATLAVQLVMITAGGLGRKCLSLSDYPVLARVCLQISLGLGIIALVNLVVGSLLIANSILFVGLSVIIFVVCRHETITLFYDLKSGIAAILASDSKGIRGMIALIGLIFLAQWIVASAPPIKFDALNYHLTLPAAYLDQGRIADLPWLVMSGMPQTTEMIFISLSGLFESAPLLFNWCFGLLTVLGLVGYLKEKLNLASGWAAAASLLAGYTFAAALAWGYVDWLSCLFGLGVVLALEQYRQARESSNVLVAGLFAGLAFSTKYPAGVIFLAGAGLLTITALRWKTRWLPLMLRFAGGAAVFAFPWLIKNLIFTGNPIYPFFFESGSMTDIRLAVYQGLPTYGDLTDLFLLPLRATLQGIDGGMGYSVSIGPLLLGMGLLAFLNWEQKPNAHKTAIGTAGWIALIGLVVWAVGNQFSGYLIQTRFYFTLFPAFAILAGYGYDQVSRLNMPRVRLQRIIVALMLLVTGLNAYQVVTEMVGKKALGYVFGQSSHQQYLEDNLGWYARAMKDIRSFKEGEKALLLYEPRGYYCLPQCDPDEILDQWKVTRTMLTNGENIPAYWRSQGYTHVLVYTMGMEFLRMDQDPHHPPQDLDALEFLLATLPDPANYGDTYNLYVLQE